MQRRKIFKGAGLLAAGGFVAPMAAHAKATFKSGGLLDQINKRRLLRDIRSRYDFGNEIVLTDIDERGGQLFVSAKHRNVQFELRSPDRGASWHTV